MMEGIHNGDIQSLYLYGEDTGIVDSNINFVQSALEKVDFLVVQDEFLTFTQHMQMSSYQLVHH